jgi:hypothetical protein
MGMGIARSALFPLIVIVMLVYLASQTLLSNSSERMAYGDLVAKAETSPRSISSVPFVPNH